MALTAQMMRAVCGEGAAGCDRIWACSTAAIWIKAREAPGTVRLRARHPHLAEKVVQIRVSQAAAEAV